MNLEALLSDRLAAALHAVSGRPVDAAVRRSQHADFQSGAPLRLARELRRPAPDIAADVLAGADLAGIATAEVSGPGFVNLRLDDMLVTEALTAMAGDDRLGVAPAPHPETVVIDYSGPNVAKELHVGHLRSTVIGDAAARLLSWQGHRVVRVNHLGDWGTPFGMLLEHMIHTGAADYRAARAAFDADPDFRDRARRRVVALQGGDPATRELWQRLVALSEQAFLDVYDRLGVTLTAGDFVGESTYQDMLPDVVAELDGKGLLRVSDGALCAFPDGFTGRDGGPLPLIVRKSDGGFGYAATDLAALRHRVRDLGASRLLYVVGSPQRLHFEMVYAVARAAGWLTGGVTAEHVGFGSILGPDGKAFASRSGEPVRLAGLLEEAERRAGARSVGVAALKYADLSGDRLSDYVFDWDRMLALTGNTGPYLQYAHARIRSILRRAGGAPGAVRLTGPAERALALELLAFPPVVEQVAGSLEFHRLAAQVYQVATAFSAFYERCPVLAAPPDVRAARLALCELTARVLRQGLGLLGIDTPERM